MASPIVVTDKDFDEVVLKAKGPVLVDFWAPWCPPCRMLAPIVEELAGEYSGRVAVAKLNTDENSQTSLRYGVKSIPTLLIFKGGKPMSTLVGYRPKADLKKQLDSALA